MNFFSPVAKIRSIDHEKKNKNNIDEKKIKIKKSNIEKKLKREEEKDEKIESGSIENR